MKGTIFAVLFALAASGAFAQDENSSATGVNFNQLMQQANEAKWNAAGASHPYDNANGTLPNATMKEFVESGKSITGGTSNVTNATGDQFSNNSPSGNVANSGQKGFNDNKNTPTLASATKAADDKAQAEKKKGDPWTMKDHYAGGKLSLWATILSWAVGLGPATAVIGLCCFFAGNWINHNGNA